MNAGCMGTSQRRLNPAGCGAGEAPPAAIGTGIHIAAPPCKMPLYSADQRQSEKVMAPRSYLQHAEHFLAL